MHETTQNPPLHSPATTPAPFAGRIRALFLDVDGTLISHHGEVSIGVREAIARARERGCEVALCTGRSRFTAEPIAEQIGKPGYAVTSNGGVVLNLGTGEVLLRRVLPIPVALTIIRAIDAAGANPYVYEDAIIPGVENARILYHPERELGDWANDARYLPHARILEELPYEPVSVSTFGPPEAVRPLADHLRNNLPGDVSIIESGTELAWGIEVFAPGVSKALGLETVAARLGVEASEVMAIGDHMNDLEMIRWAGIGVAMGNAIPEILQEADVVTASVAEDGVARAIERFILV